MRLQFDFQLKKNFYCLSIAFALRPSQLRTMDFDATLKHWIAAIILSLKKTVHCATIFQSSYTLPKQNLNQNKVDEIAQKSSQNESPQTLCSQRTIMRGSRTIRSSSREILDARPMSSKHKRAKCCDAWEIRVKLHMSAEAIKKVESIEKLWLW